MADGDQDLCYITATEALTAFKARELSPAELMKAVIARSQAVNPKLNAYADTYYERRSSKRKRPSASTRVMARSGRLKACPSLSRIFIM